MRLTPAQSALLARLALGESFPKSRLSKALLRPLQKAGVVRLEPSGSSYVVRGLPGKLATFAEHEWGITNLAKFADEKPDKRTRESLAELAGDSKALPSRPLEGILIRSFGNVFVHGKEVSNTPPGCAFLISPHELSRLELRAKCLIGIENSRCFLHFEKCARYFDGLDHLDCALVLRWSWGAAWREWLRKWRGTFLHFPDYDPSGLSIFSTEVLPYATGARLLIPSDLPRLLAERGTRSFYVRQEHLLPKSSPHQDVSSLSLLLQKCRRGLEQEKLLF
jgi:hypothetical protein